jgi:hypothetical protein
VAEKFSQILAQIRDGVAPWRLHAIQWDYSFLDALISGASTNVSLVDHATSQVGCGDLCIIAERDVYRENSGIADVRIWSIDDHLHAHG